MKTFPARIIYRNAAAGMPPVDTTVPASRSLELLAVSAAKLLFRSVESCRFHLCQSPDVPKAVVFQAITADACVQVGPFRGGPKVPGSLSRTLGSSLPELLAHLGAAPGPDHYAIHIRYHHVSRKPIRPRGRMTETERAAAMQLYEANLLAHEQAKEAENSKPSMRTVHFPIPPAEWRREDLEAFIGRVYAVLPAAREIYRVEFEADNFKVDPAPIHPGYRLQIATDEFTAKVCISQFPADALADWLEERHFSLRLELPQAAIQRAVLQQQEGVA